MPIPIYQVDAFASELFQGNPAAVCLLESWLDDDLLQSIAAENNLAETAYLVPDGDHYKLRWFTPTTEVDLCGHATLASGFVVLTTLEPGRESVSFATLSGELEVKRADQGLEMDLPAIFSTPAVAPGAVVEAVGEQPAEAYAAGDNFLLVYESEQQVRSLAPDTVALGLTGHDVIATAQGEQYDCVSRYFAPAHGIPEDPVTGAAHCALAPYWTKRLERPAIDAFQASERGGELRCELRGERVVFTGSCVKYLSGVVEL